MALFVTLLLAVGVGLLMLLNTNRAQCRMRGHDWGRPYTDDKQRLERCERCFRVRDHVFIAPTATHLSNVGIDGTAPVVFTVSPRVVEVEPEPDLEAQAARAEWLESVKAGAARRRGEGSLSSGRVQ